MKSSYISSGILFLAALSLAGPLRPNAARNYLARSVAFSNTTRVVSSTSTPADFLTIIPVHATSTSLSAFESTSIPSSSSHVTSIDTVSSTFVPSETSITKTRLSLEPSSTLQPTSFQSSSTSQIISTTPITSVVFSNATAAQSTQNIGAGVTTATPLITSLTPSSPSSVPRFSLNNTSIIPTPTNNIPESSTLAASAGFQEPSSNPTTLLTIDFSTLTTSNSSSPSTRVISTSTSSSSKATSISTSHSAESTSFLSSTQAISVAPTVISTAPPASGTISPDIYNANLAEAQQYNLLFSTLNFSSPCTGDQVACVAGNVAQCTTEKSFKITEVCADGNKCYALPVNTTKGVFVGCASTGIANNILGLSSTTTTLTPISTQAAITLSSGTVAATSLQPSIISESPQASKSFDSVMTLSVTGFLPPSASVDPSKTAPAPSPAETTEVSSPLAEPLTHSTTTTTLRQSSTLTVYITESSKPEPVPAPTPAAASPTVASPGSNTVAGGDGLTIIPVGTGVPQKETVTVTETVTTTERF